MEQSGIRVVDLMITGVCNLNCPFCYGPDPNDPVSLTEDQATVLIDFLRDHGVEGVVIAGGEPTLSPILDHTVQHLVASDMWVALQTNATRPHRLANLLHNLNWIALPLDSVSDRAGLAMRTAKNHHRNFMRFAQSSQMQQARENGTALKIGTVVTRENIDEIGRIGESIQSIMPDVWKLYEFRSRGAGRINATALELPQTTFLQVAEEAQNRFPDLEIVISPAEVSLNAYLIINPDSTLLIPQRDSYLSFGRLVIDDCTTREDVWASAARALSVGKLSRNVAASFPEKNPWASGIDEVDRGLDVAVEGITPTTVFDRDGR
ncbi:radical SAM protein [Streptomyces sp. NBC_00252]|uniref:radical SAM protein n=1 Tax=Streptomyces sp. NBC_00252 TaxID=2975691 RepID=UPI002E283BED|nr:radical SAM protein [Streptomyces sp. NBC_00252]